MSAVLVTGATGVLGRRTVPALVDAGHAVTALARTDRKAAALRAVGATPTDLDLFDPEAVRRVVAGHDAVMHLATNIPTGVSAGSRRAWRTNDRLRREAAHNLTTAVLATGVPRYVQESITFPYVDSGDAWIDEAAERAHFWGNASCVDAEAAATAVTSGGGAGVVLRFAMFMAADSAHMVTFRKMATRGLWGLFGADDTFVSFVHVEDAAAAAVAALDVPAGVYNVAEPEPTSRGAHRTALASAVGRERLWPVPGVLQRLGGAAVESLARSQRISSDALRSCSGWKPSRHAIDEWEAFE